MREPRRDGWRSVLILFVLFFAAWSSLAAPSGVTITYNETYNYTPQSAATLVTAGGSFTTMNLNITAQTLRWKAYVGNATGVLTLDDANNKSIYDWTPSALTGEIYASRSSSVSWNIIGCAQPVNITNEETALNINSSKADSINSTFNQSVHRGFFVGTVNVSQSGCPAISTYINDTRQATSTGALFQEVLLSDNSSVVYATLIEDNKFGFNNQVYDFQIILPTDEFAATPTAYYFWAEIG